MWRPPDRRWMAKVSTKSRSESEENRGYVSLSATASRRLLTGSGRQPTGNGQRATSDGQRAEGDGQRPTGDGRRGTCDARRATSDGQRVTGDMGRATGSGRRVTGDGQRAAGNIILKIEIENMCREIDRNIKEKSTNQSTEIQIPIKKIWAGKMWCDSVLHSNGLCFIG